MNSSTFVGPKSIRNISIRTVIKSTWCTKSMEQRCESKLQIRRFRKEKLARSSFSWTPLHPEMETAATSHQCFNEQVRQSFDINSYSFDLNGRDKNGVALTLRKQDYKSSAGPLHISLFMDSTIHTTNSQIRGNVVISCKNNSKVKLGNIYLELNGFEGKSSTLTKKSTILMWNLYLKKDHSSIESSSFNVMIRPPRRYYLDYQMNMGCIAQNKKQQRSHSYWSYHQTTHFHLHSGTEYTEEYDTLLQQYAEQSSTQNIHWSLHTAKYKLFNTCRYSNHSHSTPMHRYE